jgi:hypothetical protein
VSNSKLLFCRNQRCAVLGRLRAKPVLVESRSTGGVREFSDGAAALPHRVRMESSVAD